MLRFDLKMVFIQCEYAAKNIMLDLSFPLGSWECGDARIRKYQSRITKQIKVLFSFLGEIDALSREPLFLQLQTIKNEWQSMAYNRDVWRSEIPYYRQKFISCVKQIKKIVNSMEIFAEQTSAVEEPLLEFGSCEELETIADIYNLFN